MKPVIRFISRGDGLIIGTCFKNQSDIKAGKVYEISSVLDELIVNEIGDMPELHTKEFKIRDVNTLLDTLGKYLYLTDKEYEHACTNDEDS
jgi:hypothetical protein